MALLLAGNTVPSAAEVQYVQTLLMDGEAELAQIRRAKTLLAAQEQAVLEKTKTWRTILSPIRRLPSEIFSEIFTFWLFSYSSVQRRNPLFLCSICAQWRRIAFNTPRLWTHPDLCLLPKLDTDDGWTIMESFLSRSHPHSLNVSLTSKTRGIRGIRLLLQPLLTCTDRLSDLSLCFPRSALYPFHKNTPAPRSFPKLETVEIDTSYWDPSELNFVVDFSRSPRLRKVTLSCKDKSLLSMVAFPWSQLKELDCFNISNSPIEVRLMLRQCYSLERCSLGTIPAYDPQDAVHLPISTLPHLTSLSVAIDYGGNDERRAAPLFQPIDMPALAELDLTFFNETEPLENPLLTQYLYSRSGATLTTLRLDSVLFNDGGDAALVLQTLPALRILSADLCWAANDDFFHVVRYRGPQGPPPVCPRLEELHLYDGPDDTEYVSIWGLSSMVTSRWWSNEEMAATKPPVARWKKISISWEGAKLDVDEDSRAILLQCREQGLSLDVNF